MTTTLFLVRHAAHEVGDAVLVGRTPEVRLSEEGRQQARLLGRHLQGERFARVYSSPRERTCETARAIVGELPFETDDALDEIDFGEWTGRSFTQLSSDERWQTWNAARSLARAPGGESMLDVQRRALTCLERIRARQPQGKVLVVSHGDVIRAVLLYYLGLSLDAWSRLEVSLASISVVAVGERDVRVLKLNDTLAA